MASITYNWLLRRIESLYVSCCASELYSMRFSTAPSECAPHQFHSDCFLTSANDVVGMQGFIFASKKRTAEVDLPSEESQPLFAEQSNAHST